MPLVLIIALIALAAMYVRYRRSGLGRNCRWRRTGPGAHLCAFCGARLTLPEGQEPNRCLRRAGAGR